MRTATLGLALALALAFTLSVAEGAVTSFAEFRKGLINMNPAKMTSQCRKVMLNCATNMMGLLRNMDIVERHWDDFANVPCVSRFLELKFPDYSQDCVKSGLFGKAWDCLASAETMASLGNENDPVLTDAYKCAMQYSKP